MTIPQSEPVAAPWRVVPLSALSSLFFEAGGRLVGRPLIVAVDGRSGSGKSTLAERLRTTVPDAEAVGALPATRMGDLPTREQHDAWMAEEFPFLAADRPWERATLIVAGTSDITHDPIRDVVIAPPPLSFAGH